MDKISIVSGKALTHFFLTYRNYKLYSPETKMDIKEIEFDKWYQVGANGNRAVLYEVSLATTDSEVRMIFGV